MVRKLVGCFAKMENLAASCSILYSKQLKHKLQYLLQYEIVRGRLYFNISIVVVIIFIIIIGRGVVVSNMKVPRIYGYSGTARPIIIAVRMFQA